VSSLQTTATFDYDKDEFIIHTPTPTATKWWPGDLGLHCTHAIVFARCIIKGNQFGVLPFLVPLRSLDTFMPLKGVELGDMGPKFGYNSKNNGWATFDQVRIPRDYMLNKFTKVDREGNFSVEGDIRVLYSVMMDIRTQLVFYSGHVLFTGLLIAGRYSAVRRQFKNTTGSKLETKLLDYQT
jgi:acyl-CoA oxidase